MPEPRHLNFTGERFTERERNTRQRKRLAAWLAECRKADKLARPLERKADDYARWIAERDGIAIPPDARPHCCLAPITEDDGITRNRVFKVQYFTGQEPERRGYYGATTYRGGKLAAEIEIPHWDFVPRVTEFWEF